MEINKTHVVIRSDSFYFYIPKTYIKEGKINPNKSYKLIVEEEKCMEQ